jgi:MFS family permease
MKSRCAANARTRKAEPRILAAAILGSSMAFIVRIIENVALPALQNSPAGTVINMQWAVEAYGLFLCALILNAGSTGDLFGRGRMFLPDVSAFAVASGDWRRMPLDSNAKSRP